MSNRTVIIASAIIAGSISLLSFPSITINTAQAAGEAQEEEPAPAAANECLAGPKATTPAGAHWYYRIQKGTGRKCWYLADEGAKVKKSAEKATAPAAEEDAPSPKKKPMQKSLANARAELTTGSTDEDSSLSTSTWPPLPPSADTAVRDNDQTASIQPTPQPAAPQGWNIASRWPEPKSAPSAGDPSNVNAQEPVQPNPTLTQDRLVLAAASAPAPAATPTAAVQRDGGAKATEPSSDDTAFPIRVILSVLVCAMALAAIIGPMIFKYIRPRPRLNKRAAEQRRPIWEMDISRETVRQDNPRPLSRAPYADPLPEPRVLDEAVDELEQLLSRASRRPAA